MFSNHVPTANSATMTTQKDTTVNIQLSAFEVPRCCY
jgi:hypothetical protein